MCANWPYEMNEKTYEFINWTVYAREKENENRLGIVWCPSEYCCFSIHAISFCFFLCASFRFYGLFDKLKVWNLAIFHINFLIIHYFMKWMRLFHSLSFSDRARKITKFSRKSHRYYLTKNNIWCNDAPAQKYRSLVHYSAC